MPSGLMTWLTGGGNTATSLVTITDEQSRAEQSRAVYQAIQQAQHGLLGQTASSAGGWTTLYTNQQQANTASVLTNNTSGWVNAGPTITTTTTASGTVYWYTDTGNYIVWEDTVTPAQYIALAHRRVAFTEEQRQQLQQAEEANRRMQEEENARWRAEEAERAEQRKAALVRSRELLLQHLTPAQRKTFEENAWFIVQGGHSKKSYRIRTTGYTGNIEELDRSKQRALYRLCGHLRAGYALHDHHVAQKISLEYDEEAFVNICNRHVA